MIYTTTNPRQPQDTNLSQRQFERLEALLTEYPNVSPDDVTVMYVPSHAIRYQVYIAVDRHGKWIGNRRFMRCLSNSKAHAKAGAIRAYIATRANGRGAV